MLNYFPVSNVRSKALAYTCVRGKCKPTLTGNDFGRKVIVDRVRNIVSRDMHLEYVVSHRDSRTEKRVARIFNRENRADSENSQLDSRRTMNQEIR